MSEQEKTTGEGMDRGSSMVVIETASSKYTGPFRPTEMPDDASPDLHQKRAPAVASLSENWKDSAEVPGTKDLKESEYAMSSDRHKHSAKKITSQVSKKRESHLSVAIPMTPIETESKTGELKMASTTTWKGKPPVTPIPDIEKKKEEKKDDEDSITSEITELRTPEAVKKTPEWESSKRQDNGDNEIEEDEAETLQKQLETEFESKTFTKDKETGEQPTTSTVYNNKENTWNDENYLRKVPLKCLDVRSSMWMLERKASVGPCYLRKTPSSVPSGITISLPQKESSGAISIDNPVRSGICIVKSKRSFDNNTMKTLSLNLGMNNQNTGSTIKIKSEVGFQIKEDNANYISNLKGKLSNFYGRIKHNFHI